MTPTNAQIIEEAARRQQREVETRGRQLGWMNLEHYIIQVVREGWKPPKSVDPNLFVAREIVAAQYEKTGWDNIAAAVREGRHDRMRVITCALAAYKAGKEVKQ